MLAEADVLGPHEPVRRRLPETLTGYGYGHFDGRPVALHTGDNPGYKSLVALSNDEAIEWG